MDSKCWSSFYIEDSFHDGAIESWAPGGPGHNKVIYWLIILRHLCGISGQLHVGHIVDGPEPEEAVVRSARLVHCRVYMILSQTGVRTGEVS